MSNFIKRGKAKPHFQYFCGSDGNVVATFRDGFECPFCGDTGVEKYCPNCGAVMEGGEAPLESGFVLMAVEELADMFLKHDLNLFRHCPTDELHDVCLTEIITDEPCRRCWAKWLQQEAECTKD